MEMREQNSSPSYLENLSFAVVGLACNCSSTLKSDVYRIREALGNSNSIVWLIVESDSSDQTVSELGKLESEISNFSYVTLGELSTSIPKRTDRISHCRNYYAEQIRSNNFFSAIEYVIVADFDGINTLINRAALESCWKRKDWDMCSANQKGPYYDIWALRHKNWCAEDCWAQYRFLNNYSRDFQKNINASIYSKMITISEDSEWIEVDSAFGGFAIYKKSAFDCCEYIGITESGEEFCEHTYFHRKLIANGAKLFINPKLINAGWTEHTSHLLLKNRIKAKVKFMIKSFLLNIIDLDRTKFFKRKLIGHHKLDGK